MESGGLEESNLKYFGIFEHHKIVNNLMNGEIFKYHMFLDQDFNKWLLPVNANNLSDFMVYSVYKLQYIRYVDVISDKKIPVWGLQTHFINMSYPHNAYGKTKNVANKYIRFITSYGKNDLIGQGTVDSNSLDMLSTIYQKYFTFFDYGYKTYIVINKPLVKKFYKSTKNMDALVTFISDDIISIMRLLWSNIMASTPSNFPITDVAFLNSGPLYQSSFVRDVNPDLIHNQIKDIIVGII